MAGAVGAVRVRRTGNGHAGRRCLPAAGRRRLQLAGLRPHFDRAALQPARRDHCRQRQEARYRRHHRAAERTLVDRNAARRRRRDLFYRQLQPHVRRRRAQRQTHLGVRSEIHRARRRSPAHHVGPQSRTGLLQGQADHLDCRRPPRSTRRPVRSCGRR